MAYIDILLAAETHNRQASQLREIIEKRMKKGMFFFIFRFNLKRYLRCSDGLLGLAVIGGGAIVVTGIVAALLSARR